MAFSFNEELHEYTLNGTILPSVTQIISPLNDFSRIAPGVLERKRQIGTAVHKAVELYLNDDLDMDTLDDECQGYFEGFLKWMKEDRLWISDMKREEPQYHPKLKYAGTPDLDDKHFIADIKCRSYNPITDPLQLTAYKHFGNPKRDGYVLELKKDGTYHLQKVPDNNQVWGMFRKLLDHRWSEIKINELIRQWRESK